MKFFWQKSKLHLYLSLKAVAEKQTAAMGESVISEANL